MEAKAEINSSGLVHKAELEHFFLMGESNPLM